MHKVSPNSAGAMFGSPHRCRPPLLHTDKKEQGSTQGIGIGTSYHQILRAQCVAPRCRRPALLNTDKGRLCQIRASPVAKKIERHHFFMLAFHYTKITCFFDFFNFFNFLILNPMASNQSTIA